MEKKTKAIITVLLSSVILCTAVAISFGTPKAFIAGDVNGDGEITAEDVSMLARHVAKIEEIPAETGGDVWLSSEEAKNLSEKYSKAEFVYSSWYDEIQLHVISLIFRSGHVEYISATYSLVDREEYSVFDEEPIIFQGQTYYYGGAEGCWFLYEIDADDVIVYDDTWNAYHFIIDGDNLCLAESIINNGSTGFVKNGSIFVRNLVA